MSYSGQKSGQANLPLHYGQAPPWLFQRMTKLSRQIAIAIVDEYGSEEMLRRLSHPYWFQALGCVLGFDWHSSGVTTTVCGALKAGIKGLEKELGFFAAGGKGGTSRHTPDELQKWGQELSLDSAPLIYASRTSAKVDSSAIQDGFQLYHHAFFFSNSGSWAVVQQGMNKNTRYARRYHWLGENVHDFVNEPHSGVSSQSTSIALDLVAEQSAPARQTIAEIVRDEKPEVLLRQLKQMITLSLPARHALFLSDLHPDSLQKILLRTYEQQPTDFEQLLGLSGVGPKTIRALSLICELIHGIAPTYRDPARYSFAHGGKDGIPYPVDRKTYDESIESLSYILKKTRLETTEKRSAALRLDVLRAES
ncbi:MAG: DUF763 domain-containing protein [Dehalococcoidia bacterium]|nr:DUF763 domain-containing protein [Dehalococcoidia bacterium]